MVIEAGLDGFGRWVPVYVPERFVPAVMEFAARQLRQEASTADDAGGAPAPIAAEGHGSADVAPWTTAEQFARLKRESIEAAPCAVLDLCSQQPGKRFSWADIVQRAGIPEAEARGQQIRFAWLLKRLFGSKAWPAQYRQGANGRLEYWMTPEQARLWRES